MVKILFRIYSSSNWIRGCIADYSWSTVEHILLYSRFNKLVIAFQFSDSSSIPISVSDPYIFPLPRDVPAPSEGDHSDAGLSPNASIAALHLLPLKYVTRPNITPTGPGQTYIEQGVTFFKLFILDNDLSLRDCLYASGAPVGGRQSASESVERPAVVKPPDDRPKLLHWAFRSTRVVSGDGFVADDGTEEGSEQGDDAEMPSTAALGSIDNRAPHMGHANVRVGQHQKDLGDVWTLNFEPIYNLAFLQSDRPTIEPHSKAEVQGYNAPPQDMEETRLDAYLRTLEGRVLTKRDIGFRPTETL